MKTIKTAKYLNVFNIFFIIVTSLLLGISIITQSVFSQVTNFVNTQQIIIDKVLNYLNLDQVLKEAAMIFNNFEIISIIVTCLVIFFLMGTMLLIFIILNMMYNKVARSSELKYSTAIISGFIIIFLLTMVIGQFSVGIFNFILYYNPIFTIIKVILLLTLLIQLVLIAKYIIEVYQEKGIKISNEALYKAFKITFIIIFIGVTINLVLNMIIYIFAIMIINSINYIELLRIDSILNLITNNSLEALNVNNVEAITSSVNLAQLTLQTTINNFIQSNLGSFVGSYFIGRMIPAIIILVTTIYLTYANRKIQTFLKLNNQLIAFVIITILLAVYLMTVGGIILSLLIGGALLLIVILKAILIYQHNPEYNFNQHYNATNVEEEQESIPEIEMTEE